MSLGREMQQTGEFLIAANAFHVAIRTIIRKKTTRIKPFCKMLLIKKAVIGRLNCFINTGSGGHKP